jgi:hypothetical protein
MRVTLLCLAVLFLAPHVDAAPTPAPVLKAKEKLEALKKKLPDVVSSWAKERWHPKEAVEFRVVRMLGPTEAKVVLVSHWVDRQGRPNPNNDNVFTFFLVYYDGVWSPTRSDATWLVTDDFRSRGIRFLMLVIDEAAEK